MPSNWNVRERKSNRNILLALYQLLSSIIGNTMNPPDATVQRRKLRHFYSRAFAERKKWQTIVQVYRKRQAFVKAYSGFDGCGDENFDARVRSFGTVAGVMMVGAVMTMAVSITITQ